MSIVLLAILAAMWVAFLLPVAALAEHAARRRGLRRRRPAEGPLLAALLEGQGPPTSE